MLADIWFQYWHKRTSGDMRDGRTQKRVPSCMPHCPTWMVMSSRGIVSQFTSRATHAPQRVGLLDLGEQRMARPTQLVFGLRRERGIRTRG
jgi:hypothetical protein